MRRSDGITKEVLLLLIALFFLSPIYIIIVNSFKDRRELYENALALPEKFSFQYYLEAMEKMNFLTALGNSLYITIFSVIDYCCFIFDDSMDVS